LRQVLDNLGIRVADSHVKRHGQLRHRASNGKSRWSCILEVLETVDLRVSERPQRLLQKLAIELGIAQSITGFNLSSLTGTSHVYSAW